MMYLSKLELNMRNRGVRKDLSNCVQMHRTIMSAFKDIEGESRKELGVLHRVMENKNKMPIVLVQSKGKPDWGRLKNNDYLIDFKIKNIDKISAVIDKDRIFGFNTFASPTKQIDGKRYFLKSSEEQIKWLKRKMNDNGALLRNAIINKTEKITGRKKGRNKITNIGAEFQGTVKVDNPERFYSLLKSGLGMGKAYGFGLISLYKV